MKGPGHAPGGLGTHGEPSGTLMEPWPGTGFPFLLGVSCACSSLGHRPAEKLTEKYSILYVFLDHRNIIS